MGLKAHNLGGSELRSASTNAGGWLTAGAPLVSANTTDRGGKPIVAPLKIVDAGGRRIAMVGVVSPHCATAEIQVAPPGTAVLSALHDVAGQYDSAIVLAYLPTEELESLAHELPEVDAVVGGPTLQSIPPHKSGPTLVTSVTNKGKFLATLRWQRPRDKSTASGNGDWDRRNRRSRGTVDRRSEAIGGRAAIRRGTGATRFHARRGWLRGDAARTAAGRFRRCRKRCLPQVPRRRVARLGRQPASSRLAKSRRQGLQRRCVLPTLPHERLRLAGRIRLGAANARSGQCRLRKLPRPGAGSCERPANSHRLPGPRAMHALP